jgi:2'-5' RNA ligase
MTWRVFCAIDIPAKVRIRLITHIKGIQEAVPDAPARWSRADNIHLTLKFLGNISRDSVHKLSDAASRAVKGLEPFKIRAEGIGAFPPHESPRVLWIGIEDCEGKLAELHARLEAECETAGFPKESRHFHPHLTLARLRKPQHARMLAAAHKAMEFEPAEISVSELLVIKSELSSAGSTYTTISRHPFQH